MRVRPRGPATIVDGSAPGVTALAAFGQLDGERPLLYAADQSPAELRRLAREGASIVITDSNRKRAFVNSRIRANTGRTLDAGEQLPPDVAVLDPFDKGADAQTVAVYGGGASYVRGTIEASFSQFPERGPMAAFDGDPRRAGSPTRSCARTSGRISRLAFSRPRDVETIALLPYGDRRGRPVEVSIAGRKYALTAAGTSLRLELHDVSSLRVEISRSAAPPRGGGPGGVRELRVPGLHVSERLRTPLIAATALRGQPLDRSRLTVLLERTTPFSPLRLSPPGGELQDRDLRNRADGRDGHRAGDRAPGRPALYRRRLGLRRLRHVRRRARPPRRLPRRAAVRLLRPLRERSRPPRVEGVRRSSRHELDRRLAAREDAVDRVADPGAPRGPLPAARHPRRLDARPLSHTRTRTRGR